MSNAAKDHSSDPGASPASRKVSLDPTASTDEYEAKQPVSPAEGIEGDYLTIRAMHPVPPTVSDFMMNDYPPMMGSMQFDPYGMPPPYMPMHPAESMGSMMDFSYPAPPHFMRPPRPPARYVRAPPRRQEKLLQPRNGPKMPSPACSSPALPAMGDLADLNDLSQSTPKRRGRAPSGTSFPTKLYKILEDPRYKSFITWLPHGRAWRVLKPKAFEEEVIPKFFRSDRYASFMRQVNGWGFKRITEGPDLNAYYHEMFLRGLPEVCGRMRRPHKGQNVASKGIAACPDFYKISKSAPLPHVSSSSQREPASKAKAGRAGVVSSDTEGRAVAVPGSPKKDGSKSAKQGPGAAGVPQTPSPTGMRSTFLSPSSASSKSPSGAGGEYFASGSNSPGSGSRQGQSGLSPVFPGGRDFVDLPTSSGNSVSSWSNEHPDSEFMWMATSFNQPPPGAFGQVTPPSARPIKTRSSEGMSHSASSSSSSLMDFDTSGLSAADLCYLTRQNRILLSQTNGPEPPPSRTGSGPK